MKIGILTWHSQLNYGGILQCWALQTELERLGHEAVVIDRWLDGANESLTGKYPVWTLRDKLRYLYRGLFGCGDFGLRKRHVNTRRFIERNLHRSAFHFCEWREAPEDLGVDLLVVGSDQLWHCNRETRHDVYLLENAPPVPAVAYAASFGRPDIPAEFREQCVRGFRRFSAISVRESQAVKLVESCGAGAVHVADPTLLVDPGDIFATFGPPCNPPRKTVVCYFLSQSYFEARPLLETFARQNGCSVEVFVDVLANRSLRPTPHGFAEASKGVVRMLAAPFAGVRLNRAAGPREFLRAVSRADAVVTDSFHGLMFSAVYGKNARILRPATEFRRLIFGRIEEFAERYAKGPCIEDSLASALGSLAAGARTGFDMPAIDGFRKRSRDWLERAIGEARP
jgi:hypothetical protein